MDNYKLYILAQNLNQNNDECDLIIRYFQVGVFDSENKFSGIVMDYVGADNYQEFFISKNIQIEDFDEISGEEIDDDTKISILNDQGIVDISNCYKLIEPFYFLKNDDFSYHVTPELYNSFTKQETNDLYKYVGSNIDKPIEISFTCFN